MEKAAERHADDSRNQLSARLAGRGNRTPQGGLVQLRLTRENETRIYLASPALCPSRRDSRTHKWLPTPGALQAIADIKDWIERIEMIGTCLACLVDPGELNQSELVAVFL